MRHRLKQSMKAVLAILAGALLTTGGLSWVEADSQAGWHHDHTVYAFTNSEANGKYGESLSSPSGRTRGGVRWSLCASGISGAWPSACSSGRACGPACLPRQKPMPAVESSLSPR